VCLRAIDMTGDLLLKELEGSDRDAFTGRLGTLYEHSSWIAAAAWPKGPFQDRQSIHDTMQAIVRSASIDQQLALIRAHPDLAGRLARSGTLEAHSTGEQTGLGLDRLSDVEYERFDQLNTAYRTRFGFPFIIAARAHTRETVVAAFKQRLGNSLEQERGTALDEIGKIAWFRLQDLA
ncbi:MAG: 2-oxo-4-hydroxy-4-carboxy-5-ureidoimidazoline decarboxylase, partial [Janthinobacterium lividum]